MNIWTFNQTVSQWLLRWNLINIVVGVVLVLRGGFWRGVGGQNIGWGIINIMIALFGAGATERRLNTLDNPHNPAVLARETRNMRRILLVNSVLDVLYMVGGWRFAQRKDSVRRGTGIGIVIQGALLFLFDVFLLTQIPDHRENELS